MIITIMRSLLKNEKNVGFSLYDSSTIVFYDSETKFFDLPIYMRG